MFMFTQVVQKH